MDSQKNEQLTETEQVKSNLSNLDNSTIKMDFEAKIIETTTKVIDITTELFQNIITKDDLNKKDLKIEELQAITVNEDVKNENYVEEDQSINILSTEEAIEAIEINLTEDLLNMIKNENTDPELQLPEKFQKENNNTDIELNQEDKKHDTDTDSKIDKDPTFKIDIQMEKEIKVNIESDPLKMDKNTKMAANNENVMKIKYFSNENLKNEYTEIDGNVINKIEKLPTENANKTPLIDNSTTAITKVDPKFIQYFDNIILSPHHKIALNNEEISSLSDSNIEIPSKKLKRIKLKSPKCSLSEIPLTDTSQNKIGVKKSYSCIGKFNHEPIDSNDFYCKIEEKSQKPIKDNKKLNKLQDDFASENSCNSDNQLSSSPTSSSSESSTKNILRDKTELTTSVLANIKQRPKSTPNPLSKSVSSTSSPIIIEKKQIDTTGNSSGTGSSSGAPILKRESFIRQSFNKLFRKNSATTTVSNASSSNSSNSSNSSSNSEKSNSNQNNNNNGSSSSGVEKFLNSIIGVNLSINSNSSNNNNNSNNNIDKSKNNQKSNLIDDFEEIFHDNIKSINFNENIQGTTNQQQIKKRIKLFSDSDKNDNKSNNNNKCPIKIRIEKVPSESDLSKLTNEYSETKHNIGIRKNNSFIVNTKRSTNNVNIGIRSTTDSQMAPLQGQSETNGQSIINLSTLNKNQNHYQSSNNLNQNNSNSNQNINNYNNNNNINANNLNSSNSNLNSGSNNLKTDTKSQKQLSSSPIASSSETKQQQQQQQQQQSSIITTTTSSSSGGSGQQQQPLQSTHNNYQQQQSQERPARSISPHPIKSQSTSSVLSVINDTKSNTSVTVTKNDIPEKEKKRKELSSSRKKKFHRHFQQVSKDERVLNYFSCALVSDILLQGHLYITENYFAFYSNVFGFVTKLLIPTSSVVKISKEKTAKIIPNAVGVATIDERHVFGSFMSREAAFRLMCSVCPPLEATESIVISPKVPVDAEICEEYSVEDDSSCSISGNESPAQLKAGDSGGNTITGGNNCGNSSSDASHTLRHRAIPIIKNTVQIASNDSITDNDLLSGDTESGQGKIQLIIGAGTPIKVLKANQTLPIKTTSTTTSTIGFSLSPEKLITSTTTATATTGYNTSPSSFKKVKDKLISLIHFKFPTEVHVVYIGIILAVMLTLFSLYLMYRILDIEAKASYRSTIDISNKWSSSDDNNDNIYAEALKWQKELQAKSTEEAQNILSNNLELIARVRKSLKALSMLIHDRHSSSTNYETQYGKSIITEHDDEIIS